MNHDILVTYTKTTNSPDLLR